MEADSLSITSMPNMITSNAIESNIFPCKICSKSFSNKLSRNRHQLYCRKKHFSGLPNVRKSCAACRRAKVKCNSDFPVCSRCQVTDKSCVYERTAKSNATPKPPLLLVPDRTIDNVVNTSEGTEVPLDLEPNFECASTINFDDPFEFDNSTTLVFDNTLVSCPTTPQDFGSEQSGNLSYVSLPNDWLNIPTFGTQLPSSTFEFSILPEVVEFLHCNPYEISESMFVGPYLSFRYPTRYHGSLSRMSTLARRVSPFIPTARPATAAIGNNFILQNLKAYPALVLSQTNLPPFIHHSSLMASKVDADDRDRAVPKSEHLAICKNIVQMYATKTPQTKGFIWRSVEAERLRFAAEYSTTSEGDALSMLQAITIYILLRIFDDENTFSIDFDVGMVETMTVIAIKLEQSGFLCSGEVHNYRPEWQEWILMESKRRIVIILFLVCLLFDISPDEKGKALAGLSSLPLPATKKLWHAETEEEWQRSYDEMLCSRGERKYLSYADLVFLGKVKHADGDVRIGDLNAWFTDLDGFGVLTMMAATTF